MADPVAWVALPFGALGTGLSAYKIWSDRKERKEALVRDVRVEGTFRPHPDDPANRTRYTLTATNFGRRPVQIVRAGVVVADGTGLIWHGPPGTTPNLPVRLDDGESVTVDMPDGWVELLILGPYGHVDQLAVQDAMGQVYYSEIHPRSDPAET